MQMSAQAKAQLCQIVYTTTTGCQQALGIFALPIWERATEENVAIIEQFVTKVLSIPELTTDDVCNYVFSRPKWQTLFEKHLTIICSVAVIRAFYREWLRATI